MAVDERRLLILAAVVERFIETGEPVGSKYVAQLMNNTVSSATIRNDMAALEEEGLLEHIHTSSGRVPTHLGYRVYINRIMKKVPLRLYIRVVTAKATSGFHLSVKFF